MGGSAPSQPPAAAAPPALATSGAIRTEGNTPGRGDSGFSAQDILRRGRGNAPSGFNLLGQQAETPAKTLLGG